MKRTIWGICLLFLLTACSPQEGTGDDSYFVYEPGECDSIVIDEVTATACYDGQIAVLGQVDAEPVLVVFSGEGETAHLTLPAESYCAISFTEYGIDILTSGVVNSYTPEGLSCGSVETGVSGAAAIARDGNGSLWLLDKKALYRWTGSVAEPIAEELQGAQLFRMPDGMIGLRMQSGVLCAIEETELRESTVTLDIGTGIRNGSGGAAAYTFASLGDLRGRAEIRLATGGLVSALDWENSRVRPLFDTAGWTASGTLLDVVETDARTFLCLIFDEAARTLSCQRLTRTERVKQVLTIARFENNSYVTSAVARFNRSSSDYYVAGRGYFGDNARTKLHLDMISGRAPDLVSLHEQPYEVFAQQKLLLDLQPLVDATYPNGELYQPVLDTMRAADGGLYRITPVYQIDVLAVAADLLPEPQWNLSKLREVLETYPDMVLFEGAYGDIALQALLPGCMSLFVDESTGTCSFDSERFCDFLRMVKEVVARKPLKDSVHPYQNHEALLCPLQLYSFRDYQAQVQDGMTAVGYPSENGSGVCVFSVVQLGICAATERSEAAWTFMTTLLSEELQAQADWLPLRTAALEQLAVEATESLPGQLITEYTDPLAAAAGTDTSTVTMETDAVEAMTTAQIEEMWRLLSHAEWFRASVFSDELLSIVREEAAAFLLGDRAVEDVAAVIQNRVGIYLAETRK